MTAMPPPPGPEPAALVQNFLALMQARDLPAAQALLAPGFCMFFPGGAAMHRLDELVQWARQRYRFAGKHFERFDTCVQSRGAVVYCRGTLYGEWLDGTPFDGVRFIDRFEIAEGKITRQDVWNDMGEA
ncbi:MAG: nuclear transport factor 2 family protein, partial [Burkholderiaceae bacterium]